MGSMKWADMECAGIMVASMEFSGVGWEGTSEFGSLLNSTQPKFTASNFSSPQSNR